MGAAKKTASNPSTFQAYYRLTKPGIIYGNLMTAAAGYFFGSPDSIDFWLLLAVMLGTSLVIASGCVFNNYLDRGIDEKMARTKKRALVTGIIPVSHALIFGTTLGVLGFSVLWAYTSPLVTVIGAVGFIDYVALYGWAKRHSVHGTLVGSIAGAMPLVAGYCAAAAEFDTAAFLLFLVMVAWQMAHFYGIAIYRRDDYAAAGVPVLPVVKGMHSAKRASVIYIAFFTVFAGLIAIYDYAGYVYLIGVMTLGVVWLTRSLRTYNLPDDKAWGRKMFGFSLIVLMCTSALLAVGPRLP